MLVHLFKALNNVRLSAELIAIKFKESLRIVTSHCMWNYEPRMNLGRVKRKNCLFMNPKSMYDKNTKQTSSQEAKPHFPFPET